MIRVRFSYDWIERREREMAGCRCCLSLTSFLTANSLSALILTSSILWYFFSYYFAAICACFIIPYTMCDFIWRWSEKKEVWLNTQHTYRRALHIIHGAKERSLGEVGARWDSIDMMRGRSKRRLESFFFSMTRETHRVVFRRKKILIFCMF